MTPSLRRTAPWGILGVVLLAAACGGDQRRVPAGTLDPDKLLFERGAAALNDQKWFTAREYFRQIVEGYPQSPFRADAKLGTGDTYLGEGGPANAVLALNEFREFLAFYPTHERADYAQYKMARRARPSRSSRSSWSGSPTAHWRPTRGSITARRAIA
jgi:outer membrane protein assembly factor BamD (BamD/ComL family)